MAYSFCQSIQCIITTTTTTHYCEWIPSKVSLHRSCSNSIIRTSNCHYKRVSCDERLTNQHTQTEGIVVLLDNTKKWQGIDDFMKSMFLFFFFVFFFFAWEVTLIEVIRNSSLSQALHVLGISKKLTLVVIWQHYIFKTSMELEKRVITIVSFFKS